MTTARHYCPACGAGLVSEPIGAPLRCKHCGWRLVSCEEWRMLEAFQQGYVFYAQASWQTSELKDEKNPYPEGSPQWKAFREGEHRAMLNAQDGEE